MNSLVSCRIRLARNFRDYPFPHRMEAGDREALVVRCAGILTAAAGGGSFTLVPINDHNQIQAGALVEEHLISPEMLSGEGARAAILSEDRRISVMLCEEDHLRIQAFGNGFDAPLDTARRISQLMDEHIPLAFAENLGFLTACPSNLGTALRASVMLHLPCLTQTGRISGLGKQMQNAGLSIRGFYGEKSRAGWGYYQISNAKSFGFSENELCAAVWDIAGQLEALEEESRKALMQKDMAGFEDQSWRAWGLLSHARRITTAEAMEALSRLRPAAIESIVPMTKETVDALSQSIWPGRIMLENPDMQSQEKRDEIRAKTLREALKIADHTV